MHRRLSRPGYRLFRDNRRRLAVQEDRAHPDDKRDLLYCYMYNKYNII